MNVPRSLSCARQAFATHCEEAGAYELVSVELIDALAAHLASRREDALRDVPPPASDAAMEEELEAAEACAEADLRARMQAAGRSGRGHGGGADGGVAPTPQALDDPAAALRILEVGAGNGELTHYLRAALRRASHTAGGREESGGYSVVACDASSGGQWPWSASPADGRFGRVEGLDYREALQLYRPHVVLCSWMPMGEDWSAAFRRCPSVREYVLLGEVYDGVRRIGGQPVRTLPECIPRMDRP